MQQAARQCSFLGMLHVRGLRLLESLTDDRIDWHVRMIKISAASWHRVPHRSKLGWDGWHWTRPLNLYCTLQQSAH